MTELPAVPRDFEPDWIDYNGHLRDAYYVVALSVAVDEVMDHLGLDAAYRERTRCTLYTLELHIHYLHEIKATDELSVVTSVLDYDAKRIHAACDFLCPRIEGPAACGRSHADACAPGREAGGRRLSRRTSRRGSSRLKLSPPRRPRAASRLPQDRDQAAVSRVHGARHPAADRTAQHRAHRRHGLDRCGGGRQCRRRLPGNDLAGSPEQALDAAPRPSIDRSPSCPRRRTPRSSRCPIARRRRWPERSRRAAPAASSASPPASPSSARTSAGS